MSKIDLTQFYAEQSSAIPNAAHLPVYRLVQTVIQEGVAKGVWKTGQMLPTERELAQAFAVSVGTVKRAMLNLTHEGLLNRKQGSGTFVSGTLYNRQNKRYYLFLEDFDSPAYENSVLLHSVERVPAIPQINKHLRLSKKAELFSVLRTFREEGKPLLTARSFLSAQEFQGLDAFPMHSFEHVPFFIMLEQEYGVTTLHNEELFGIAPAPEEDAALLGVAPGTPLLLIKTIAYTHGQRPFEYRYSHCLADTKFAHRSTL